jgi:hypothetical protein
VSVGVAEEGDGRRCGVWLWRLKSAVVRYGIFYRGRAFWAKSWEVKSRRTTLPVLFHVGWSAILRRGYWHSVHPQAAVLGIAGLRTIRHCEPAHKILIAAASVILPVYEYIFPCFSFLRSRPRLPLPPRSADPTLAYVSELFHKYRALGDVPPIFASTVSIHKRGRNRLRSRKSTTPRCVPLSPNRSSERSVQVQ